MNQVRISISKLVEEAIADFRAFIEERQQAGDEMKLGALLEAWRPGSRSRGLIDPDALLTLAENAAGRIAFGQAFPASIVHRQPRGGVAPVAPISSMPPVGMDDEDLWVRDTEEWRDGTFALSESIKQRYLNERARRLGVPAVDPVEAVPYMRGIMVGGYQEYFAS